MIVGEHHPGLARHAVADAEKRDAVAARIWPEAYERSNLPELARLFDATRGLYGPWPLPHLPPPIGPPGGEVVFTGEKYARLHDADETPARPNPVAPEFRAELKRHARAEREYLDHAREETGMGASPEEIERQTADRSEVRRQSHELARRLEFAGKNAYRNEAFSLWVWWVHSRKLDRIPNFRRICLLPYVAAIVRASKLAALEFFIQRNPFCRFWTFTTGQRCGLDELRARCQWLHRRLSLLNAFLRAEHGLELVFRSTEFGTLEFDQLGNRRENGGGGIELDANGEPLFHVHAHVVVQSLVGYRKPAAWSAVIGAVHEFWVSDEGERIGWDADGVIRNARECCKYVTKPGDMLKLTPEQLGRLHEAVFKLKLCQPLGTLAEEIRERKKAGKMLRRYRQHGRLKGTEWREVFNHNKWAEHDEGEREALANLQDAQRMADETKAAAKVRPGETPRIREKDTTFCRVFSRLSPGIGPAGLKEPRVVVGGTYFDRGAVESHPLVSRLWAQTVQDWEAGLRLEEPLRIRLDTGTPTVGAASKDWDPSDQEHPPDPVFSCP